MTNTGIYFADRLLESQSSEQLPLNVYHLYDLASLSECMLLADKISTVRGLQATTE